MKSAVTISVVPEARGGPFVFWDSIAAGCEAAAKLGFDAVELFAPNAAALTADSAVVPVAACGLEVAAVGTGAGWVRSKLSLSDADPARCREAIDFVRDMIDAAATWRAAVIIGSMQGRCGDVRELPAARERLAISLTELAGEAEEAGCELLLEPLNRYETDMVNTVADGLKLLRRIGSDSVRLLCDVFHMNIEERSIAEALRSAGNAVGHVHFADSNRRAVGAGHIDYDPIIEALRQIKYEGYLSAEVLPLPDSNAAATQSIDSFKRLCGHGS